MIVDERFDRPVAPSDCALLVALPRDKASFEADVTAAHAGPVAMRRGDFAATQLNERPRDDGGPTAEAWRAAGAPVAELLDELESDARQIGIGHCDMAATGRALSDVFEAGVPVVVLVAHWKPGMIRERDLDPDADRLVAGLAARTETHAQTLSATLSRARGEVGRTSLRLRQIARLLNEFVGENPGRRAWVDQICPELLVPGEVLELRDGYYSAEAAGRLVPYTWQGIVDLTVCTSLELARALKQGCDDRRALTNARTKHIVRCVPELRETLLRLSARAQPYIPLRARIHSEYNALVHKGCA